MHDGAFRPGNRNFGGVEFPISTPNILLRRDMKYAIIGAIRCPELFSASSLQ